MLAAVISFSLTFREWFIVDQHVADAAMMTILVFFGMILVVIIHELAHKLMAERIGYEVIIAANGPGLAISFMITLLSYGFIPIFTPNTLQTSSRPDRRLDKFWRHDNPMQESQVAMAGILGSAVMIGIFKALAELTGQAFFEMIVIGAALHMVYSLIPFELLGLLAMRVRKDAVEVDGGDGLHIWWASLPWYVFALCFAILTGGIAMMGGTISMAVSLVIAALAAWIYSVVPR